MPWSTLAPVVPVGYRGLCLLTTSHSTSRSRSRSATSTSRSQSAATVGHSARSRSARARSTGCLPTRARRLTTSTGASSRRSWPSTDARCKSPETQGSRTFPARAVLKMECERPFAFCAEGSCGSARADARVRRKAIARRPHVRTPAWSPTHSCGQEPAGGSPRQKTFTYGRPPPPATSPRWPTVNLLESVPQRPRDPAGVLRGAQPRLGVHAAFASPIRRVRDTKECGSCR
jgi:hypothetical protein